MEAMMARKRLSDLVREEANKAQPEAEQPAVEQSAVEQPDAETPPTPKATVRSQSKAKSAQKPIPDASGDEPVDVKAEPVTADPSEAEDSSLSEAQTKIQEFEATIADLQSNLKSAYETAHKNEAKLKQKITDLQTELDEKQETIDQLQEDGKQVRQLKAELEDAKKMILQLSQVNAQPAPPRPTPALNRAAEPELESSSSAMKPAAAKSSPPPKQNQIALRQILDHPTRPGKLPAMPSEKFSEKVEETDKIDIGWMD